MTGPAEPAPPRQPAADPRRRLVAVAFDAASLGEATEEQEAERAIAVHDLVEDNLFFLPARDDGPYTLKLAMHQAKLAFDVRLPDGEPATAHLLSLTPFRATLRDYFATCETYFAAIRMASPDQIEAIDEMRRQIHNDGANLLMERLKGKIEMDFDTARRLFTVIFALRWKG
jgi:uncharacterized protein (UPF0262 family)